MRSFQEILINIASGIANPYSLAAFGVAIVLLVLKVARRKIPGQVWIVIVMLVLGPIAFSTYQTIATQTIYRVRVTVLSPQNTPVENAKVWSTMGGEAKSVSGGWQFDIPVASKPKDGKLTFYAEVPGTFQRGSTELVLADDYNLTVTIKLTIDTSGTLRGNVVDEHKHAISGASVNVVGYEKEAVVTGNSGNFELPAHAAIGQQVQLHVEHNEFEPLDQGHPVSQTPATIVLIKKGSNSTSYIRIGSAPPPNLREADLLSVNVIDTQLNALPGVQLSPAGNGSVSPPTDIAGRTHIRLAANTGPGDWITLQLIRGPSTPPPWRMVSPWDGRVTVPSLRSASDHFVRVVLGRHGEKISAQHSIKVFAIVATSVDAYGISTDEAGNENAQDTVTTLLQEKFGVEVSEVNRVVAEWSARASDPFEKGMAALYMKNYPAAVEYLSLASTTKKTPSEQVDTNYFLGLALLHAEEYDKAAKAFHKATELRHGDISLVRGEVAALYKAKKFLDASSRLNKQLPFQFFPMEQSLEAKVSSDIGNILAELRQYDRAAKLFQSVLTFQRKTRDFSGEVESLVKIGSILKDVGQLTSSANVYQQALEKTRTAENKANQITILNNLGEVYSGLGQDDKALNTLNAALASTEQTGDRRSLAITLNNLGEFYLKKGNWEQAEPLFTKALKVSSSDTETSDMAAASNNLGLVYFKQKRYQEAEFLFKQALEIWEEAPPSQFPSLVKTADNYSLLLLETNRPTEAKRVKARTNVIIANAPPKRLSIVGESIIR